MTADPFTAQKLYQIINVQTKKLWATNAALFSTQRNIKEVTEGITPLNSWSHAKMPEYNDQ